jgi:hypothetical protein
MVCGDGLGGDLPGYGGPVWVEWSDSCKGTLFGDSSGEVDTSFDASDSLAVLLFESERHSCGSEADEK